MTFKDEMGGTWNVKLNLGTIEAIDEVIPGFSKDIVRDTEKLINLIWGDPQKLVMISWVVCEAQAKERNITPKQFASLFTREVLDSAAECFITEFICFFQVSTASKKMRQAMPSMMEKLKAKGGALVEKAIAEVSLKLDMP